MVGTKLSWEGGIKESNMTTLTVEGLEAKYVRRRRYLRKVLKEFKMKVDRQEAGRLYGLFKALLDFLLVNEQRVAHLEEENSALKARIVKMVSPTTMHFYYVFSQMELTIVSSL